MKNIIQHIKEIILSKKHIIIFILCLIVLTGGIVIHYRIKTLRENYEIVVLDGHKSFEVKKGNVMAEIFANGTLEPTESATLAFEVTGKVKEVSVKAGDSVKKGQTLIELDNGDFLTQKMQQFAQLEAAKARLKEAEKGTRIEEIDVQKTKVTETKISIKDSENILRDRIRESYTQSEDSLYSRSDTLFSNPRTTAARLNFRSNDTTLENKVNNERFYIGQMMEDWKNETANINTQQSVTNAATESKRNLLRIKNYLDELISLVNSNNSGVSDTAKTSLATARNNVNNALYNLSAAEEQWNTKKSSFQEANSQLGLLESGSTDEQIEIYKAGVKSVEAQISNTNVQLDKTVLLSPIDGIVTKQELTTNGEIVPANTPLVSVAGNRYEVWVNVPEVDIAKIIMGNSTRVIFDAFEKQTFTGKVRIIEPGKKDVEGVTYYTAKIELDKADKRFLPGMSADVYISGEKREQVLTIPQEALIYEDDKIFVKRLEKPEDDNDPKKFLAKKVEVQTGLRGTDGNIEILEGLVEGDEVLTSKE